MRADSAAGHREVRAADLETPSIARPTWRATALPMIAAWLVALASTAASAGVPAPYAATVVEPTGGRERAEFDLTPAVERARREHKRLYVYLGASDCPFCRRYEAFLGRHAAELLPHFARYLIVDLRSALSIRADALYIRVGADSRPYADFQRRIGDERARQLVYPSVWLLDAADLRPLMQMPAGTGTFETVAEQIEVLQLVQ